MISIIQQKQFRIHRASIVLLCIIAILINTLMPDISYAAQAQANIDILRGQSLAKSSRALQAALLEITGTEISEEQIALEGMLEEVRNNPNINDQDIEAIRRIAKIVLRVHRGQMRKDGKTPYFYHLFGVAGNRMKYFSQVKEATLIMITLLHDSYEDQYKKYPILLKVVSEVIKKVYPLISEEELEKINTNKVSIKIIWRRVLKTK